MAKQPKQVEGVYEKNPGTGVWYTRLRVNGKLVRKAIGNRAEAVAYVEKARTIRRTGSGVLPESAKSPAQSIEELNQIGGTVTLGELCELYLKHLKNPNNPDRPRDQVNPPQRIAAIRGAFGHRVAATILPYEIKDWLTAQFDTNSTRNRYKGVFSALYRYGNERAKVEGNPVRKVPQFKVELGDPRWLQADEEKRLYAVLNRWIDRCPDSHRYTKLLLRCHPLEVDIAIGTGLRKGNQYAMRWDWLDLKSRNIHIPKTKTDKALNVHILDRVLDALNELKAIRKEMRELKPDGSLSGRSSSEALVFPIQEKPRMVEEGSGTSQDQRLALARSTPHDGQPYGSEQSSASLHC